MQIPTPSPAERLLLPGIKIITCPIGASLGVLGRKWTMLILRNIGFFKTERFNQMLHVTPGLTPRVLSMRLRELEKKGFVRRVNGHKSQKDVYWTLTEKGKDVLPILIKITEFGAKWHADKVFDDKKPRTLEQIFVKKELRAYI